jgi:hypothetical protein
MSPRSKAAYDAGISHDQLKIAMRVPNVPRDEFERQVESDNPPLSRAAKAIAGIVQAPTAMAAQSVLAALPWQRVRMPMFSRC